MKKAFVVFVVIAIIGTFTIAQPVVSKYWQDVLRKPNQTWINRYGYNAESVLAFNVRSLLEVQNNMGKELVGLKAIVEALSDPNDPSAEKMIDDAINIDPVLPDEVK